MQRLTCLPLVDTSLMITSSSSFSQPFSTMLFSGGMLGLLLLMLLLSTGCVLAAITGGAVTAASASVRKGRPGRVEQLFENPNGKGTARQMGRRVGSLYRALTPRKTLRLSQENATTDGASPLL
uniref:Uncharacterized protein n=1 Tax=Anopheles merus TaxID=30066 RepID=A0A182V7S2_ANOME